MNKLARLALLLVAVALPAHGQGVKISQLPAGGTVQATDLYPSSQGCSGSPPSCAATNRVTATQIKTFANTAPTLTGTITFGNITGSTQCLQLNTSGIAGGTANPCGTVTATGSPTTQIAKFASATQLTPATSGTDYAPATSGSSVLKGNGAGGFSAAVAGTDYAAPTSGSSILFGNGSGGFSNVTIGSHLSFSAGTLDTAPSTTVRSFGATFGDTGATLALGAGSVVYFTVPYACTIAAWNITVDAGTVTFDVWKIGTGTAIPTVANTITASAKPQLSSGTALHSTTLTGWTTAVTANDIFGIQLNTVATAKYAELDIQCNQ